MAETQSPTDGMTQGSDGSYTGSVGISLTQQDIKEGDYTSFDKSELLDSVNLLRGSTSNNLLDVLKNDSKIKLLSIEASIKSASAIQESTILLSKVVTTMNNSIVEGNKNSLAESTVNTVVNSNVLEWTVNLVKATEEQTKALQEQTKAIQEQSLSIGNVVVDTSPLAKANEKIAEGVEDQMLTNAKIIESLNNKKEHYEFLKNGVSTLKDSKGEVIKPREVEAKNNAEQQIYKKDVNTFDHVTTTKDILDSLSPVLGSGSTSEEESLLKILDKLVDLDLTKFTENKEKLFGGVK